MIVEEKMDYRYSASEHVVHMYVLCVHITVHHNIIYIINISVPVYIYLFIHVQHVHVFWK